MLFPFLITVSLRRSVAVDISFVMFIIGTTTAYPFSIIEKNSAGRIYGILPIRKKEIVIGRYIYIICIGLTSLIVSLILFPIALIALGAHITMSEIVSAIVVGIFFFGFYTSVQLPGYYKFGAIKGQAFCIVPIAGFILSLYLITKFQIENNAVITGILNSPVLLILTVIALVIVMFAVSMMISISIFKNKEI